MHLTAPCATATLPLSLSFSRYLCIFSVHSAEVQIKQKRQRRKAALVVTLNHWRACVGVVWRHFNKFSYTCSRTRPFMGLRFGIIDHFFIYSNSRSEFLYFVAV